MIDVDPGDFMAIIPAPPVVLVSTLFGNIRNLAPYGMNMPVSFSPPMIALGVGASRDTYQNIVEEGEFVVAIPSPDLVDAINITAKRFPRDVSEFYEANLTPVESKAVRAFGVKECQANLECRLHWMKQAGDHYVVIGQVVAASADNCLIDKGRPLRERVNPVYHLSVLRWVYASRGPRIE